MVVTYTRSIPSERVVHGCTHELLRAHPRSRCGRFALVEDQKGPASCTVLVFGSRLST